MPSIITTTKRTIKKNSSTILTVLGTVGVIGTAIMVANATPKAINLIEKEEAERGESISKWGYVKIVYPIYIPSILTGIATIGCIFGANILNKQKQASLTSVYALLNQSYKEYQKKLKEIYGEEAHENIIDSIVIENTKDTFIYTPGAYSCCDLSVENNDGKPILFYDVFSHRYFEKTIEQVLSAEYHSNRNFTLAGYLSVNDFYDFMGLQRIDGGDDLIWMACDEYIWIDFNHRKVTLDDGWECYLIEMIFEPRFEEDYDY